MSADLGLCDAARCGARAYVEVISPDTAQALSLCGHHYGVYAPKLVEGGWVIDDRRAELEKPEPHIVEGQDAAKKTR